MPAATISCCRCESPLPDSLWNQPGLASCPLCRSRLQVVVFPALYESSARSLAPEPILVEGEASCFYHPDKRAVVPCHRCGRFLCGLCEMILNEEHLCPACLKSAEEKGSLAALDHRRILFDRAALLLALLPILFFWPTIVTGPLSVGLAIYSFTKPTGLIDRFRLSAYLAIIFGLVETVAWVWAGIALFT